MKLYKTDIDVLKKVFFLNKIRTVYIEEEKNTSHNISYYYFVIHVQKTIPLNIISLFLFKDILF